VVGLNGQKSANTKPMKITKVSKIMKEILPQTHTNSDSDVDDTKEVFNKRTLSSIYKELKRPVALKDAEPDLSDGEKGMSDDGDDDCECEISDCDADSDDLSAGDMKNVQ